jgi:class 3 adenylate cyclase
VAEERKLVTVLFADVVGSTVLGHENDPELVREVLGRYFERVREVVTAHGGSVEKFIGDAAMAVFGVPRVHDDDAERAVRSALAIRDAIVLLNEDAALSLEARIGVNTGEAVAALDDRTEFIVTGDVVNVASRLQQHARPGEVVVGPLTERLTREAIEYAPHDAIEARGKPHPLPAFTALRARTALPEQARGLPQMRARLVGRTRELNLLLDAFERARNDRRAQLFTVVGAAGVGKSRLVREFLAKVSAQFDVRVLRGRCLPYGTGVTYWPLLELVHADLGMGTTQARSELLERLDARLVTLLEHESEARAVGARLRVLLGLDDAPDALPDVDPARLPAELGWGLARYLEATAASTPVIVVIDDLQWAEPPVFEIARGMLEQTADAPIFVICIARPELLEANPTWGAGQTNAALVALEPLDDQETRTLIGRLLDVDELPEALHKRILERAAGNPLFCEEFVGMLIDEGRLIRHGGRWRASGADSLNVPLPESIHALLAARLDTLTPDAKRIVQAASVIGEQFEATEVAAIAGADGVQPRLDSLARGGFVISDRRTRPGAYRFRHLLIRDVAYATVPKSERARLHDAFGRHLEASAADRRESLVEILAHHAERALALSVELRMPADVTSDRARRALELALDSADRAIESENLSAARAFLATADAAERALGELQPAQAARLQLLDARIEGLAKNYTVARGKLERAAEASLAAGRKDLAGAAYLALVEVLTTAAGQEDFPTLRRVIRAAIRTFDELGDVRGRLEAQLFALEELFSAGKLKKMLEKGTRLIEQAEAAGEQVVAARAVTRLIAVAGWLGRLDVAYELAAKAEALTSQLGLISTARWVRFFRARLAWMEGRLDDAEALVRPLAEEGEQIGDYRLVVTALRLLGEALDEAHRLDEADAAIASSLDWSVRIGERWSRTELLAYRARFAALRGDTATADRFRAESESTLRQDDFAATAVYYSALGTVRTAQGRDEEAEVALRLALDTIRSTEFWWWQRLALDLAEFLVARGRASEARDLVDEVRAAMAASKTDLRRAQLERLESNLARQPA